jgi:hypothetical protein
MFDAMRLHFQLPLNWIHARMRVLHDKVLKLVKGYFKKVVTDTCYSTAGRRLSEVRSAA